MRRTVVVIAAALASIVQPAVEACEFEVGDLYLVSTSARFGGQSIGNGLLRIDPVFGTTHLVADPPNAPSLIATLSYDTCRDRLIFVQGGLKSIGSGGAVTSLSPAQPERVAARGDGLIYLWDEDKIWYFCDDVVSALRHPNGQQVTVNFVFTGEMVYDSATNSLLCFTEDLDRIRFYKISLTTDGSGAVSNTLTSNVFNVSSANETVVGTGYAPFNQILLVIDTNAGGSDDRLQWFDPATTTTMPYAVVDTGGGGLTAGTHSGVLNAAVAHWYASGGADALRVFPPGSSGTGTTLVSDVSEGGTRVVEIHSPCNGCSGCGPVAVEETSWGTVKSRYR